MSTSRSQGQDRVQQDYIARVRYSNTLPPPPNPPKLLDVPNTGLASGQYTAPGFAARLAREQPLNIEAGAELGMHLDLVGMPGVFDGDESSIQCRKEVPAVHPNDRLLLRPLNSMNKPKINDNASFLRRTEYIGGATKKGRDAFAIPAKRPIQKQATIASLPDNLDKDSPEYILKSVLRSFEITAANLSNPARIRHPTKRNLKLVSSHPILPDFLAMTDTGGYFHVKFATNPVQPSSVYDIRLGSAVLTPTSSKSREDAHAKALEQHQRNPALYPHPGPYQDYQFYVPETIEDAKGFKRKCDVNDVDAKDNEDIYTSENVNGKKHFRFKRHRVYETAVESSTGEGGRWNTELAVAINDGKDGKHQKAAYIYPIIHKAVIRPQRSKNIDKHRFGDDADDEDRMAASVMEVRVVSEQEADQSFTSRKRYAEDPTWDGQTEAAGDGDENVESNDTLNGHDDEQDAEAEDE